MYCIKSCIILHVIHTYVHTGLNVQYTANSTYVTDISEIVTYHYFVAIVCLSFLLNLVRSKRIGAREQLIMVRRCM